MIKEKCKKKLFGVCVNNQRLAFKSRERRCFVARSYLESEIITPRFIEQYDLYFMQSNRRHVNAKWDHIVPSFLFLIHIYVSNFKVKREENSQGLHELNEL